MSEWRKIEGFPSYEVSDDGQVRTVSGRVLRLSLDKDGYVMVGLSRGARGSGVTKKVHHLVLEAFVGPRLPGQETRHLDGVRDNNRATNLRWGTRLENMADKIAAGTHPAGHKHSNAKLTEDQAREIRALRGLVPQAELAKWFRVCQPVICRVQKGYGYKEAASCQN